MNDLIRLRIELKLVSSEQRALATSGYFQSKPGGYGEGDEFIGVSVPEQRKIAKRYKDLGMQELDTLLTSQVHEERLTALFILVWQFKHRGLSKKKEIYDFYLSHTSNINNWDLVDSSALYIVGAWLEDKDKTRLVDLAKSENIWERRIAVLATFAFIKKGDPEVSLQIAEMLLYDKHDLIQKAVGWMLREIGKSCSREIEEAFLMKHYKTMPRITLRYSIEHFPEITRKKYLKGDV